MLRVTYLGGDAPQRWLFDADDVTVSEGERIEQAMGRGSTWDDFVRALLNRTARARRVLLWHLMRRDHPDLSFSDVPDFKMGQLTVEYGTAELADLREQINANLHVTPEKRDEALALLEEEFAEAALFEAGNGEAELTEAASTADPKDGVPNVGEPDPIMLSTAPAPSPKSARRTSTNSPRTATSRRGKSTD